MGRGGQFTYIPTLPLTWRLPQAQLMGRGGQFTYIPTLPLKWRLPQASDVE